MLRGDNGMLPGNIATNAVYPMGNGRPGKSILINSDFNLGSLTQQQATWNLIHAIGHVLGLKHSTTNGSIMYKNSFQTNYLGQDYLLPIIEDINQVTSLYPLSSSDVPQPFIRGTNVVFNISYPSKEVGVSYNWTVSGINGTIYSYSEVGDSYLSDLILPSGSYRIECIINGGKYTTPIIVSKNIII